MIIWALRFYSVTILPSSATFSHWRLHALETDEQELLILADKIPQPIRKRFKERPDAFRQLADLDDTTLDEVLAHIDMINSITERGR